MTNKKGTAIVEAAIVFPIIIIVVLLLIKASINYYQNLSIQVEDHISERKESMIDGHINNGEAEFIRNLDFMTEALQ